jgi:hypothetical protein
MTSCNLVQIYRRFGGKFLPDYTESHTETPSGPQNSHSLTEVSVAHTISISRVKKDSTSPPKRRLISTRLQDNIRQAAVTFIHHRENLTPRII